MPKLKMAKMTLNAEKIVAANETLGLTPKTLAAWWEHSRILGGQGYNDNGRDVFLALVPDRFKRGGPAQGDRPRE